MPAKHRPWKDRTYSRVTDRRRHLDRCPKAYLDPDPGRPRYQVAPRGSCSPTCRGLQAAYRRAIMNRERGIAEKTKRIAQGKGCPWATKERTP